MFGTLARSLSVLLLAACGATGPVDEKSATVEAGFGRAFGSIEILDNGKPATWGSIPLVSDRLTLFVRPAGGGEMQYMDIPEGGGFFWPLRPGEYVVVGGQLVRATAGRSIRSLRLMTSFSVPRPGAAVYIGDLVVESRGGASRLQVLDRYDAAAQRVREALAAAKLEPAKALMRLEPEPGNPRRITPVCGGSWGVTCDSEYQGVRPLQPEPTVTGHMAVDTLTPTFEWQPSRRAGVTYDIAIYESLQFIYSLNGAVERMRGERVVYAEGLREPRYVPPPLAPGKRYQWSVRVRDGDTVSTWSTGSYSLFLVVAGRRASGQYFGFETPAAP